MELISYSTYIWLSAIFVGSISLVVCLGSNKLSSTLFSISIFWVMIWITIVGFFVSTKNPDFALILLRISYYTGTLISSSFLLFFLVFPYKNHLKNKIILILTVIEIIFLYFFIFTDLIIQSVFPVFSPTSWGWNFGQLSFVFEIIFFSCFGLGIWILFNKYKFESNLIIRKHLKFMLLTIVIGSSLPSILSIILPRIGIFTYNWLGPITQLIWIPIIFYSILKYKQMDVKTVVIEVLAIGMTFIFFINIFINLHSNIPIRITTFIIFITLAFYLIRTSLLESKQREQLADLNLNLAQKVEAQTLEVRRSYEYEKKAKRDLEKLNETKDQFIILTQHNLRTPITTIRNEIEYILSGKEGEINKDVKHTLTNTLSSIENLTRLTDDFLNISALKVGSQILNLSNSSLLSIVENVIQELRIDIENLNLNIQYSKNPDNWPVIKVDINKIREVLQIIIENAVKYNIKSGNIDIQTNTNENDFTIIIRNTGVGFIDEDRRNIFDKLFYRSKKAKDSHPTGMGIGLSISKTIINAHHGKIGIFSHGENMGAEITLTLPINFLDSI